MNKLGLQRVLPLQLMDDSMSGELLRRAIERRGIKKKHVAQKKGIEQGTLSRQLSGKHSLTLKDLREYADILDCEFEELIIDIQPIEIIGNYQDGTVFVDDVTIGQRKIIPPMTMPSTYKAIWEEQNRQAIYVFNGIHMLAEGTIDPACFTQLCIYKVTQAQLKKLMQIENESWLSAVNVGYVYPEPSGKFTIGSAYKAGRSKPGLELVWAAPIIAQYFSPQSLGWQCIGPSIK